MPTTANPPTASPLGGVAVVVLITALFGAVWGLTGAFALPGVYSYVATLLVIAATVVFLLAAARFLLLSRRLPSSSMSARANPFRTRAYRLAVLFEAVAIPVAVVALNYAGYAGALPSTIAVIVGLHFFGFIPAFRLWSRRFVALGGGLILLGLISLLLPAGSGATEMDPRGAAVGLGCALVLWGSVLPLALSTGREVNALRS